MSVYSETKETIEANFAKLNELHRSYKVVSYDTTGDINALILAGSDDSSKEPDVKIYFYGVEYISLKTAFSYPKFSLADWQDADTIQLREPAWVVCMNIARRGGEPAKYFVATERMDFEINT